MKTMNVTCGTCLGVGKYYNWKATCTNEGFGTMEREEVFCEVCNGRGYTEYATFTLEEAKAILEHCGLNTED